MSQSVYPGFTLNQFFTSAVIPITVCKNKKEYVTFANDIVEFDFNEYGYRTRSFSNNLKNYILISGCSLTEGQGLHFNQTWANKLEQGCNIPVINLAKGGANAEFVGQSLTNWLNGDFSKPSLVIAQWPNPFRAIHWGEGHARFTLNQMADNLYNLKVKQGQEHFYMTWINNIVNLKNKCAQLKIPILNLCFEGIDITEPVSGILEQYNIDLHLDLKQQNLTWHFDNLALDGLHHSEWCAEQWTNRILTLMNNML